MEPAVFIARLIGPVFVVLGVGMLLNMQFYAATIQEAVRRPALIYISGLLAFTAGLAMLNVYWAWTSEGARSSLRWAGCSRSPVLSASHCHAQPRHLQPRSIPGGSPWRSRAASFWCLADSSALKVIAGEQRLPHDIVRAALTS